MLLMKIGEPTQDAADGGRITTATATAATIAEEELFICTGTQKPATEDLLSLQPSLELIAKCAEGVDPDHPNHGTDFSDTGKNTRRNHHRAVNQSQWQHASNLSR